MPEAAKRLDEAGGVPCGAAGQLLLLEHHHDQSQSVGLLLEMAGMEEVQAHRDLEGVRRFASGRRPSGGGTR